MAVPPKYVPSLSASAHALPVFLSIYLELVILSLQKSVSQYSKHRLLRQTPPAGQIQTTSVNIRGAYARIWGLTQQTGLTGDLDGTGLPEKSVAS